MREKLRGLLTQCYHNKDTGEFCGILYLKYVELLMVEAGVKPAFYFTLDHDCISPEDNDWGIDFEALVDFLVEDFWTLANFHKTFSSIWVMRNPPDPKVLESVQLAMANPSKVGEALGYRETHGFPFEGKAKRRCFTISVQDPHSGMIMPGHTQIFHTDRAGVYLMKWFEEEVKPVLEKAGLKKIAASIEKAPLPSGSPSLSSVTRGHDRRDPH